MASYNFHRLIMGKVKVGLYFYLIADILTKVLQKCSLSSPLPNMNFVQTAEMLNLRKIFKNHILRSHKWDEAETL